MLGKIYGWKRFRSRLGTKSRPNTGHPLWTAESLPGLLCLTLVISSALSSLPEHVPRPLSLPPPRHAQCLIPVGCHLSHTPGLPAETLKNTDTGQHPRPLNPEPLALGSAMLMSLQGWEPLPRSQSLCPKAFLGFLGRANIGVAIGGVASEGDPGRYSERLKGPWYK